MKEDNFDEQSAIVTALNRIMGVRMISHSNTFWLSVSCLYKLVGILGVCGFAYYLYLSSQSNLFNFISCLLYLILFMISAACAISLQILGWWYYKKMTVLRKYIAETDESLKKMNVVVNHRNVFVWVMWICAISLLDGSCLAIALCVTYTEYTDLNYVFGDLLYSLLLFISGIVVLDYMVHICWLRNNFKHTNDLLRKFFIEECQIGMEEWNNKVVSSWLERCLNEWQIDRVSRHNKIIPYNGTQIMKRHLYPTNKISMLQQIRYIHLQLCIITKSLNSIFDKQLMFFATLSTLNLVGICYYYYVISTYPIPTYTESLHTVMKLYVLDAVYVWIKVVLISRLCEKTAKEAKEIIQIIHVCSIHNSDTELKNELVQFSLQVSLSEMDRDDSHLFWLNDTFVTRSIGTVVTYLVVVIQWNEATNSIGSSTTNSTVAVRS